MMTLALWIAALVAATVITYRKPDWGGALLLTSLPAYLVRTGVAGLPTTLLEAVALGAFAGFYGRIAIERRLLAAWRENKRNHLLAPALFLLASAALAAIVPADRIAALGVWRAYFLEPIVALPLVFVTLRDESARRATFVALAAEAIAIAAIAALQAAGAIPAAGVWAAERRATGIYPFPNAVGLFLGPLVPFLAALAALGKDFGKRARAIFAVASAAAMLACVASQTEAAIGAAAIALLVLAIAMGGKVRKGAIGFAVAATLLALAVSPIRATLVEKLTFQDWSGTVRRVMWRESLAMLMANPVFGAGISGYPSVVTPFHMDPKVEIFQYPHDVFLNIWSELGVIGAVAVAWTLAVFLWTLRLKDRDSGRYLRIAAGLAVLQMAIHGLVDVPYMKNDLAFLTWMMLVLPSAASASARLDSSRAA